VDFDLRDDCGNTVLGHFSLPSDELFQSRFVPIKKIYLSALTQVTVEHTFDGNLVRQFMEDAAARR
jgi:hypothetical protein